MRFADVVGHTRPIARLRQAFAGDRVAHAMLFAGPSGIGKRLVADACTALAICEQPLPPPAADACGVCGGCRQLAAGAHPDVKVVTLPKNKREIPIESTRELNQFLRLQPARATRKAAIVDDAHLLNATAQNALLKGLEEPPPGSVVMLVSNNADALLPTVRSRSQRVLFAPLSDTELTEVLVGRQGLPAAEVERLAVFADGSPGRLLRLRALFAAEGRTELLDRLARLEGAGYGAVVLLAAEFARSDELASLALEWLLRRYRRDAAAQANSGNRLDAAALARRADLVIDGLATLRRRAANRPLLLESVFAQLARP